MTRTEAVVVTVQIEHANRTVRRLAQPDEPSPWLHRALVLGVLLATCAGYAMAVGR